MAIKKVAIAGANGNLGPAILTHLLAADYDITILSRNTSTTDSPSIPGTRTVAVDYTSLHSLTTALQGQDAVIATIGTNAASSQLLLIEAAARAGVQRFIPSEFGSDTLNPLTRKLPVFAEKVKVQEALVEVAGGSKLTYTFVVTGPFLDWGLKAGVLLNAKGKEVRLWDGGERGFSTTTLDDIGRAVVRVLGNLAETENRAVYVKSAELTLRQLLELGKKAVGEEGWKEIVLSTEDALKAAYAESEKANPDFHTLFGFLINAVWGDGYGGSFEKTDNELLGIRTKTNAEMIALIKESA